MKIKDFVRFNPLPSAKIHGRSKIGYIDTSSVADGALNTIQHLTGTFPSRAQREVCADDILISSVRPSLKHNYFVKPAADGMVASTGFIQCRVQNPKVVNPQFLYYFLTSPSQIKRYIHIADCSQSAYPSFNKDVIEGLDFPNLPIQTQLRIAGVLGSLDEKIEVNRQKIRELEALAKTIYDYWFVQFDFPDKDGRPYKSSGGKMVWNDQLKREVPEGWKVVYLPQIANYLFGNPFDSALFNAKGNGFPIVRIRNVKDGYTSDYTTETAPKEFVIKNGDFIIGMDGYFDMNHWIGGEAYLVQRSCRIRAKNDLYDAWLSLSLSTPIKYLEQSLTGATLAHLGKAHLDRIMLPLPPQSMSGILAMLNNLVEQKVLLGVGSLELRTKRDTLLPLLMNGQVSVEGAI